MPADGNYHHVVATMNGLGSTAKIYIDGVDTTHIVGVGQTILNTAFPLDVRIVLWLGATARHRPCTTSSRSTTTALTQAQVTAHYQAAF